MMDRTPPRTPVIICQTHKDGISSSNNCPVFNWSSSDNLFGTGIKGYKYLLDQNPNTEPNDAVITQIASASYRNLANGVWYFHLKSSDMLGNQSKTAHFTVVSQNNELLPSDQIYSYPNPVKSNKGAIRFFVENDSDIYIDFFNEAGWKVFSLNRNGTAGVNTISDIDLTNWANGVYLYKIKAVSKNDGAAKECVKKMLLMR
jgi:hypothetical protein